MTLTPGKIKWHFQHTPNDPFDYDSVAETVLADVTVQNKSLNLALEADRNGFGYCTVASAKSNALRSFGKSAP